MQNLKNKLINIAPEIYTSEQLEYSKDLFDKVLQFNLDEESLAAAHLMKSEINDEGVKKKIEYEFGGKVLEKLELLKRISSISFPEKKRRLMTLRDLFVQITDDLNIIFIILAERLQTLEWQDKKGDPEINSTAEECLYLYAPIAQRLGISKIYNPMEDISFRTLYPGEFKKLNEAIESRRKYFNRKLAVMRKTVRDMMEKNGVPVKMQSRVKRPYSIYRKIQNKGVSLDEIYDLLALRVITNSSENCYLALGVVHSNWEPVEGRFRDWITFPKKNGYRSIQTTVKTKKEEKFEIQIRTEEMHHEAEYGSAAHWSYKQGDESQNEQWVNRLKEFLQNDEYFNQPEKAFERLKSEITRKKIFILTPKGEIIPLKSGSTPVDFAYGVHTDLGSKVTGARINGKFAKLNTELKSGDVVQVISSKNATPSRDWLDFVATSRAKSKIQRWFKQNEKQLFINEGKKTYEKLKRRYKKRLEGFDREETFKIYLQKNGFANEEEFYYAISNGHVKASLPLLKNIFPKAFEKDKKKKTKEEGIKKVKKNVPQIKVEGLTGIETKLAKCCRPVKGEPVIAYVTKRDGVKIHNKNCIFLDNDAIDKQNLKKAEWISDGTQQTVRLKLFGGSFDKMLDSFSDEAAGRQIHVLKTEKQYAGKSSGCLYAELEVSGIDQLNSLLSKLKLKPSIDNFKKV